MLTECKPGHARLFQKFPFPSRIWANHLIRSSSSLLSVHTSNGTSISSIIFVGLTSVSSRHRDTPTDHGTSVTIRRIYSSSAQCCDAAWRCGYKTAALSNSLRAQTLDPPIGLTGYCVHQTVQPGSCWSVYGLTIAMALRWLIAVSFSGWRL